MAAPSYITAVGQNTFTTETQIGGYQVQYPLAAAEPTAIMVSAPFAQVTANYSRPAANTLLSFNGTNCYFVSDEHFRSFGRSGPVLEWERTWASIPATWTDYDSTAYTFPGYAASVGSSTGRVPITKQVTRKITNDFFLVGAGLTYTSPDLIPVYFGTTYLYGSWSGFTPAEYLAATSTPSTSTYNGWVTTDATTTNSYSIESSDSLLTRYAGNIWRRQRMFVKAR